ncbi:GTP 3',8-cyclase MoaA [Romboutsia sp.]|uniref:GTP 3',8-cyclase MoaA n=1 Tax=Romboutsia sp. TaxID=1965302 RepID=UPI003F2D454D
MIDNYNRKIDYARISLTEKCNLKCIYCVPADEPIKEKQDDEILSLDDYKIIIKALSSVGISKIRFTGGEPLQYRGLDELVYYAANICKIKTVSITTNGIGLKDRVESLMKNGLNTINISLDTLDKDRYKKITGGGDFDDVIESIKKAMELNLKVKINCVFIKGINSDELSSFIDIIKNYPIDIRFIELMPIGQGEKMFNKGFINLKESINSLKELEIDNTDEKSVATYYRVKGGKGRIGIITPLSCMFCKNCNRIRITSDGNVKLCLHSKEEIDIKPFLKNEEKLNIYIEEIIKYKPKEHSLNESNKSNNSKKMYQLGG